MQSRKKIRILVSGPSGVLYDRNDASPCTIGRYDPETRKGFPAINIAYNQFARTMLLFDGTNITIATDSATIKNDGIIIDHYTSVPLGKYIEFECSTSYSGTTAVIWVRVERV